MRLNEPETRRRNPTLLPLVDVIFLLLIFFMFSSNLSPFSLLQLTRDRTATVQAGEDGAGTPMPATLGARDVDVIVTVAPGASVRVNGERIDAGALGPALATLRRAGAETLVIAPTRGATVQDLVTALEAARRSGIPRVAIRQ